MTTKTKVGVVVSHPIQYFSPLFDLLTTRNNFNLSVAYWNDAGVRPHHDPGFGIVYEWDIDLLGGHDHQIMTFGERITPVKYVTGLTRLVRFIANSDLLIIHGYSSISSIVAIFMARISRTPFLFRSDTSFRREHSRFSPKNLWPRLATRWSAGALAVGFMNAAIHEQLGSESIHFAPFAIDTTRFEQAALEVASNPTHHKSELGLAPKVPVVAFSGKLLPPKRVQDLVQALGMCRQPVQLLIIGDGPMRRELERQAAGSPVVFTGFLNQSEIPHALACADVLVLPSESEAWGLAVNEAMASGCIPVVSSAVGCAPDLVSGLGEIYEVGNVRELAEAMDRATAKSMDPVVRDEIRLRLSEYGMERCAAGYESAVKSVVAASPWSMTEPVV
jgi:glycosyltransferase involved in cell wall biosynthesis